jgi:Mg-chelatase subunit ChlD
MISVLKRAFARPKIPSRPFRPIRTRPTANTVLAIDTSTSMRGPIAAPNGRTLTKLDAAKEAMLLLAQHKAANLPQDLLGGVHFGSDASEVFPLTKPGHPLIAQRVQTLTPAGSTNLEAGLRLAMNMLRTRPSGFLRSIVLLSDGQPDSRTGLDALVDEARRDRIRIHTIGVGTGPDLDEALLRSISSRTVGGTYQHVLSLGELARALRAAA